MLSVCSSPQRRPRKGYSKMTVDHRLRRPRQDWPPRMQVDHTSTTEQLQQWRTMYENSFFNPGICIKEVHVIKALEHLPKGGQCSQRSLQSAIVQGYPRVPAQAKSAHLQTNQGTHTRIVRHHFRDLSNLSVIKEVPTEDTTIPPKVEHEMPYMFQPGPETPFSSRPLLRRPRVGSDISLVGDEETSMDTWRHFSYTTVCQDDPLDPNGFYRTNFPLLLQRIPRRLIDDTDDNTEPEEPEPLAPTPRLEMADLDILNDPDIPVYEFGTDYGIELDIEEKVKTTPAEPSVEEDTDGDQTSSETKVEAHPDSADHGSRTMVKESVDLVATSSKTAVEVEHDSIESGAKSVEEQITHSAHKTSEAVAVEDLSTQKSTTSVVLEHATEVQNNTKS